MDYDPVKDRMGRFFWKTPARTKAFYRALDAVFLRSWYVRRQLREIVASAPADRPFRVLDAGTGFGQYAYWLVDTFPHVEVVAVDVKEDYLLRARAFLDATPHGDRVTLGVRDLTYPMSDEDAFDLCLSVDVMEHIEDDRAVFRNFARVLKPGGWVLINTPSDLGGSGVTDEGDESWIGEHVRDGYNADDLREKLETAGLADVRTEYAYGAWGSAAWRLLVKWPIAALNTTWATAPLLAPYYAVAGPLGLALNRADLEAENEAGTGLVATARKLR
ncbi:MAG TPA: class I SAM-dependent methyltransferase [Bacteroidetes bacterium]|nr:class I SAM-dependent methyltransferase [Bacteroidota bacterium]